MKYFVGYWDYSAQELASLPSKIAYQYDGTFVNGVMHGYGRLEHICSDINYK